MADIIWSCRNNFAETPGDDRDDFNTIYSNNNHVYFHGNIEHKTIDNLNREIMKINDKNIALYYENSLETIPPIHLHINSTGGSIIATLNCISIIRSCKSPVYTYVEGLAASSALLIVVVGKKRYIDKYSKTLIHQVSGSVNGKFNELKDGIVNMEEYMETLKKILTDYTKLQYDEIDEIMKRDIFWDAEKSKIHGIIDEII